MTTMDTATARFDVRSADGTTIAVWVEGDGPALVMVHGSMQDHTDSAALVGELRAGVTTYAVDRRGFGASGDHQEYSLERETEDVAAVVGEVAARTGGPVALWGHSYGASCAMGAATLTTGVGRLLLYEPSIGLGNPPGWIETYETMVAEGDREGATVMMFRDLLEFSDDQIDAMWAGPEWSSRVAVAHTWRGRRVRRRAGSTGRVSSTGSPRRRCCSPARIAPPISGGPQTRRRLPSPTHGSTCSRATHTSRTGRTPPLVAAIVRDFIAG